MALGDHCPEWLTIRNHWGKVYHPTSKVSADPLLTRYDRYKVVGDTDEEAADQAWRHGIKYYKATRSK